MMATENPPWDGQQGGRLVLLARNLTLNCDTAPNNKYMFGVLRDPLFYLCNITVKYILSVQYHSEIHFIKPNVITQRKRRNGDLNPKHNKTTKRPTTDPTTDTDRQVPTI